VKLVFGTYRMAAASDVIYAPPSFEPSDERRFGFYILNCGNRFDEFDRQISEEMRQENEVNSEKLLMRRLLAFETRVGSRPHDPGEREPTRGEPAPLFGQDY
jgi:hypothetical protein